MPNHRIRLIALGLGVGLAGGAAFVAACSSDDTVTTADAGNDVTPAPPPLPPPPPGDDSGPKDSGNDSAMFDGAVPDFVGQLAVALCHSAARCCFGSVNPPDGGADGGSFDEAKCLQLYRAQGWEGSNRYMDQTDASSLVLDTTKAANCIAGVESVACDINGTDLANLRTACYGAFAGTKTTGSTCRTSLDCAQGNFCATDGGDAGGTCLATRPPNGACGDYTQDPGVADELCSWRGAGGDEYCNIFSDFDAGTLADAGDWKCQASNGIGGNCNSDGWCTAAACDIENATYKCVSPATVYPPSFCAALIATH